MEIWKMIFLLNWVIFRFHVNFQGCTGWNSKARKGKKGRAYPSKIGCQYRFSNAGPQGERVQVGIRGCGSSSWEGFLEKEKRNTFFFLSLLFSYQLKYDGVCSTLNHKGDSK